MKTVVAFVVASIGVGAGLLLWAQESPTIRVTTRLVQVDVIVRDKNRPVANLKKEDFTLLEKGKERQIASFPRQIASRTREIASSQRQVASYLRDVPSCTRELRDEDKTKPRPGSTSPRSRCKKGSLEAGWLCRTRARES